MLEDVGTDSESTASRGSAPPSNAATVPATTGGDPDAIALAMKLLGEPAPLAVTADGMSFRIPGWALGAQAADSMDGEGLACWVSVDILLLEDGRYLVREHRASEGADGMIESDSSGSIIESGAEVRAYCTQPTQDSLLAASRVAALDNAMRRWPPLRSSSGRAGSTPLAIPFLD